MTKIIKPAGVMVDELFNGLPDVDKESELYYGMLADISVAIVNYRIANGLNQHDLADKLGVSQAMISKYEKGTNNISIETLCRICTILELPLKIDIGRKAQQYSIGSIKTLTVEKTTVEFIESEVH